MDSLLNQDETAVDCGGSRCPGCDTGQACATGGDCASGVCVQKACASPSCDDFTRNGAETGVDCGGGCPGCAPGLGCKVAADCTSSVCTSKVCQMPSCSDQIKNGAETDTDCGGSGACARCPTGAACLIGGDCVSGACSSGQCASPLRAELNAADGSASTAQPHPFVRIVNQSSSSVPLSELTLRYYYSKEPSGDESFACYWFNLGDCASLVKATFANVTPKSAMADRYLELSFASGAPALPAGQTAEVHSAFYVASYSAFTQTNDYSFNASSTFATTNHITVYRNGVLVWGQEP